MKIPRTILNARRAPSGCLEVQTSHSRRYATARFNGRKMSAHRAAWMAANGGAEIPAGMCVLHRCDNTFCIAPEHLFLGTLKDNSQDRDAKGRNGTAGEKSITAKLTWAKVAEIRQRGGIDPAADLAKKYGVSVQTIIRVICHDTWKHPSPTLSQAA